MVRVVVNGAEYTASHSSFDINKFRSNIEDFHRKSHFVMGISVPSGLRGNIGTSGLQNVYGTDYAGALPTSNEIIGNLQFHIESTEIPGVSFATDEIRRYGVGNFERKPYVPTFKELDIVVRSDADGINHSYFYAWMQYIINFASNGYNQSGTGFNQANSYEVQYKNNYETVATVHAYSPDGEIAVGIFLNGVFPIYISPITLDWADNNIAKFQVKLSYTDWRLDNAVLNTVNNPRNPNNGPR